MPDMLTMTIDGKPVAVPAGSTVAVALVIAEASCRTSISGERRGPLCAMGICFECRASVNGIHHVRTCQLLCQLSMDIRTA